ERQVAAQEQHVRVLVVRQEVTGADRQWAAHYHVGDVVRYTKGSHTYGLASGEYARVVQVNAEDNHVTVRREHGARVTYDPRRLQGVTLYREEDRAFAVGDRVQLTAPDREHHLANRELGTVEQLQPKDRAPSARFRPDRRPQPPRPSPPGLWLRRHEPQRPGANRRPGPGAYRPRSRRRSARQPTLGLCRPLPRSRRCADLYKRQDPARRCPEQRPLTSGGNRTGARPCRAGPHPRTVRCPSNR